ncbi:DUF4179 domain-containing protein [Clostridium formicaceticum]|uniref:DUF4179 domain-containing protein n=1 Tax=Clostridium formicaceticum TaxID=1497 RepID=A0AAC9RMP8_9CLOT|nr:DUF4179 domain-containing protein [Clostridium formicaceticum]AOY77527.1 hypothetical protein BJL90_17705 [Clostridium formicaceticum]ARE88098.1 hypothetical protein CLFO_24990 [Clostridium formicaceticum]
MKNIYQLLQEIEVDQLEMREVEKEVEVTELERARTKNRLKQSIRKNKGWNSKRIIAAVLVSLVIGGTAYIGITDPAYAAGIPIIGDIFRFLDNGRTGVYDLYKENANGINISKESNGIQITVKDAIFDGKTITYTYEINTDKDLGEHPIIGLGSSFSIVNYIGGLGGSEQVEKVAEGIYIGQANYSISGELDQVKCKLKIEDILVNETNREEKIRGKWIFTFQLDAVKRSSKIINQGTEKEGFSVTINKINKTPMSFIMDYTQQVPEVYRANWHYVITELVVKDDLGNVYKGQDNGGHGYIPTGIMNWSMTFGKLDEKATKLIVTPRVYYSTNIIGVSIDENGNETKLEPMQINEDREFLLDDIIIELN